MSVLNNKLLNDLNPLASEIETIVLVCAADNNYAMPLAVTARSVLENLSCNYQVQLFIIDGGIAAKNKHKIERSLNLNCCQVKFIPKPDSSFIVVQDIVNYLSKVTPEELQHVAGSVAIYYRLFITELLPNNIDRAIYLDCDLIVNADLSKLWEADFNDAYILAVQDMWVPYVSSVKGVPYQKLEISAGSKYFNSGVMVINLQKWRADGITTKAIEYLKTYQHDIRAHDQDVLNGLFANRWGELDPSWNLTPAIIDLFSSWKESPFSEAVYHQLIENPSIIHFATNRKPWNSRHALFKNYFFEYVDKTAWAGWRLTLLRRLKIAMNREYRKILRYFK